MSKIDKKLFEITNQIGVLAKDSDNPFHKSRYLSLGGILDAINPLLFEYKLLMYWESLSSPKENELGIRLTFVDTEQEANNTKDFIFSVPADTSHKSATQGFGSSLTYIRRYALGCVFSLETAEDDESIQEASDDTVLKMEQFIKDGQYAMVEKYMRRYKMDMEDRTRLRKLINDAKVGELKNE